jgi:hypothetical protein
MIVFEAAEICAAALLGAFTVVGIMVAYMALCAVCKQIARILNDDDSCDILPR